MTEVPNVEKACKAIDTAFMRLCMAVATLQPSVVHDGTVQDLWQIIDELRRVQEALLPKGNGLRTRPPGESHS
jgi:hypothetical protein